MPTTARSALADLPTPLHRLPRLSEVLGGPRIWIKRDDQTGLALGGNKARKLEYLVGDAQAQGADTLITGGAAQSNHCRQTAAAAAAAGLACELVLGGHEPQARQGNLLLDDLLGARIHWAGPHRKGEDIPRLASELQAAGRRPYIVPYGGSSDVGALGFVSAAAELEAQLQAHSLRPARVVLASSSGASQAGLMLGCRMGGYAWAPTGIRVDKEDPGDEPYDHFIAGLANRAAERLGVAERFGAADVCLRPEYTGAGYGVLGPEEREALSLAAHNEGLLLDPVYTARAMAGLIDMIRRRELRRDQDVVFWHSGGVPALFAYADALGGAATRT